MSPPNLRDLVGDIRQAVERYTREQLVEVLVYVFKQYVVQGDAPLASLLPSQGHAVADDLEGMGFAEVMRALQLRLDLPELELFDVQGDRVFVRLGGRAMPIELPPARSSPVAATTATPAAAPPPPPAAAAPGVSAAPSPRPRTSFEEVTLPTKSAAPRPAAPAAPDAGTAAPARSTPAATTTAKPAEAAAPAEPARAGGLLEID